MKRFYLLAFFSLCLALQQNFAQRYVTEVFTDEQLTIEKDVIFGVNLSVFAQIFVPEIDRHIPDTLEADIYMPDMAIDEEGQRPVIIMNGVGTSLPKYVSTCFGDKEDPFIVDIATKMAKRGYVVFAFNSRTGINPFAPTNDLFLATLVDDAIRKAIDYRTAARYIQKDIAEAGNTYGINPEEVIAWGPYVGTYAIAAAYTTDTLEFETPSYLVLDANGDVVNVVNLELSGGVFGEAPGVDANGNPSNIPNYPEYVEDYPFDLVVSSRAVVLDTSTVQAGEPPLINFVNGNNILANIEAGPLNLPATGEFCCNVFLSQVLQRQSDAFGNLDMWKGVEFTDPIADTRSTYLPNPALGEIEGLYAFSGPAGNQTPWMWWDTTTCNAVNPTINEDNLELQVDMSPEMGQGIVDTMIRYWTPRACVLFGWDCAEEVVVSGIEENIVDANRVVVAPNPSNGQLSFESTQEFPMERLQIFNVTGALMYETVVNNTQLTIQDVGLASGIYFAKILFEDGIATKKITIER